MRETHQHRISTRERKWKEQNGVCAYCKRHVDLSKASLDHIIPVELLEEISHDNNLVMTCIPCNKRKGNYIVFTNLIDKIIYPMVDSVYFFRASYIQYNYKDREK